MKKQIRRWAFLLLAAVLVWFLCTPTGAVRFAVLRAGHPISAFTCRVGPQRYDFSRAGELGFTLEDPPYERATDSELYNWTVKRAGIFCWGRYYGWG